MDIKGARIQPYRLPFRHPWRSAQGILTERQGWLLVLTTQDGRTGLGDCAPLPEAGSETPACAEAALRAWLPQLSGLSPQEALARLAEDDAAPPAARCGIETALLDLIAQAALVPLARWLAPNAPLAIPVNATLGGMDAGLSERTQAALTAGYRVLKIKLGIGPWRTEIQGLQVLSRSLPSGVWLRLDANRAWSESVAHEVLRGLAGLPVESLEEPLADADLDALAGLQDLVPFALALDESLGVALEARLEDYPVRRLVLKPTVLGGPRRTLAIARRARRAGLECVITSALESGVGVRAAAHLAAALENSLVHGLATSSWFARDLTAAALITNGWLSLEDRPGLGPGMSPHVP